MNPVVKKKLTTRSQPKKNGFRYFIFFGVLGCAAWLIYSWLGDFFGDGVGYALVVFLIFIILWALYQIIISPDVDEVAVASSVFDKLFFRFFLFKWAFIAANYWLHEVKGFGNKLRFIVRYSLRVFAVGYWMVLVYSVNFGLAWIGTKYSSFIQENFAIHTFWYAPLPVWLKSGNQFLTIGSMAVWVIGLNTGMWMHNRRNLVIEDYSKSLVDGWKQFKSMAEARDFQIEKERNNVYLMKTNALVDNREVVGMAESVSTFTGVNIISLENIRQQIWRLRCGNLQYHEVSPNDFRSYTKFEDLVHPSHSINGRANIPALWTIPIGYDVETVYLSGEKEPHRALGGPTNMGKSVAGRQQIASSMIQDPQTMVFIFEIEKGAIDFNFADRDIRKLDHEFLEGIGDGVDDETEMEYVRKNCPLLDNVIVIDTDEKAVKAMNILEYEFERRNRELNKKFNIDNYYDLIRREAERGKYENALDIPHEFPIWIYWSEYTATRERVGISGRTEISKAVNIFDANVIKVRNRNVHFMIDGQSLTIESMGKLRRQSSMMVLGATASEIEYSLDFRWQTPRVIGLMVYRTHGFNISIGQATTAKMDKITAAEIAADANDKLFDYNRERMQELRAMIEIEIPIEEIAEKNKGLYETVLV